MEPVITPTLGVNPRDSLATSVFASPGVYAFLVGSGLSSAAGVLTGERIVADLIRKVARNRGVDLESAEPDPQAWWETETGSRARYDDLLRDLAQTDGARQALLRRYFEAHPDTGAAIEPTPAHEALASLCASGLARVVLTTNFDDLVERALEAAGVRPQVLTTEGAIRARIPLAHAECTVVKLHGDYRRLGLRNTTMELSRYGPAQRALLRQVFDEYGLVVVGWSAEWDTALVDELERTPTRRYPTYWAVYYHDLTRTAGQLIVSRSACEIPIEGADEFLSDLVQRVHRLGDIAARKGAPRVHGMYLFQPPDAIVPGWAAMPLLVVRTTALVAPVAAGTVGLIGPDVREQIVNALESSPIKQRLANLNRCPPASAAPTPKQTAPEPAPTGPPHVPPLVHWLPPAGARQSIDQARYRLGGDARLGVSALADIHLPQRPGSVQGDGALFVLDVGLSLDLKLDLATIAMAMRDGLVLVARLLPGAVASLLPPGSSVVRCDCHLVATRNDGAGTSRDNSLEDRIDTTSLRSFDAPNPVLDHSMGFAAQVPGPPTDQQAAEIVADGFNYMALAMGYLDPRRAIGQIRAALNLPAAS